MSRRFLTRDEARAFYDRFGSKQDWQRWYEGVAIRELCTHGGFAEAHAFIELGCGTGAFAEELLEHDLPTTARYLGVDSSSTMVALTRKRLERFDDRAEVFQTDGSLTFDFPDASCDRWVSKDGREVLSPDDIHQVLVEAYRLLKPDGRLCVVGLTHGSTWVSRVVIGLWNIVHWLSPRLVGGCRPVSLQDFLDEKQWRIDYYNVVTVFGIPSEVVVASKCVEER
jgi:ubiquinone/menaquinone biosynthesis C-methylase UbiE